MGVGGGRILDFLEWNYEANGSKVYTNKLKSRANSCIAEVKENACNFEGKTRVIWFLTVEFGCPETVNAIRDSSRERRFSVLFIGLNSD